MPGDLTRFNPGHLRGGVGGGWVDGFRGQEVRVRGFALPLGEVRS